MKRPFIVFLWASGIGLVAAGTAIFAMKMSWIALEYFGKGIYILSWVVVVFALLSMLATGVEKLRERKKW